MITNLENEVWTEVIGFPKYKVSNKGRIVSFNKYPDGKLLSNNPTKQTGYVHVILVNGDRRLGTTVHHLVGEIYVGVLKDDEIYHHKDTIRHHNSADNLKIITRIENVMMAITSGSNSAPQSSTGKRKRFTSDQVKTIIAEYKDGKTSLRKLSEKYDRNITSIMYIVNGNSYNNRRNCKFDPEEVKQIRQLLLTGHSEKSIAKRFNVSHYVIRGIHEYRTYKNV